MGKLEIHEAESHDDHSDRSCCPPSCCRSYRQRTSLLSLTYAPHVQALPADVIVLLGWASHGMLQIHRVAVRSSAPCHMMADHASDLCASANACSDGGNMRECRCQQQASTRFLAAPHIACCALQREAVRHAGLCRTILCCATDLAVAGAASFHEGSMHVQAPAADVNMLFGCAIHGVL